MGALPDLPEYGFTGGWHGSSHHGDKPENVANYSKMNRYHVQNLAYFCDKLAKTPDGDGSLLDHSTLVFGSNMSNSNAHNHQPLPSALIGGANGKVKGGQHLKYPDNTPLSNLLLTIVRRAGIETGKVGDDGIKELSEV